MIFDLFHSLSDPVVRGSCLGARRCYEQFISQVVLAEALGLRTVWCAESHFSSETQKRSPAASIPGFAGEVGLNADSFQLFHWIASRTERIGLGTAIHNIVGGSGGPIASADRVNMLRFINRELWAPPRELSIGVAAGRFPYQNAPFGIVPRDSREARAWSQVQRIAFYEALEIFLRLLAGEELSSKDLARHELFETTVDAPAPQLSVPDLVAPGPPSSFPARRWEFETLRLVPPAPPGRDVRIVLGSSDPEAFRLARRYWDVDLFNLSFTPPEKIAALHADIARIDATWSRARLPRTVLVFADPDPRVARERADAALDVYVEAMRGTAQVPDKQTLVDRALIGDAAQLREQLSPGNRHGFDGADRLMLWFEFNQLDGTEIERQMRYFVEHVVEKL